MADQKELGLLIGAGGLVLVGLALASGGKPGQRIPDGHRFGRIVTEFDSITGARPLQAGKPIQLYNPSIEYDGPGIDVFTYLSIRQQLGGSQVTVYGSGVAGVHVGPSSGLRPFRLVSDTQPQPADGTCNRDGKIAGPWMCAYIWGSPSTRSTPICGAPPVLGPADIWVECFFKASDSGNGADADGFSSPTCYRVAGKPRLAFAHLTYRGKVVFV
jgi:hypothetical protein